MSYSLDSNHKDIVDLGSGRTRLIKLFVISLICIGLPLLIYFIMAKKRMDPFVASSEGYPAVLILMIGLPIMLFVWMAFALRKQFKAVTFDDADRSMKIRWQGFFNDWDESVSFNRIRSFSIAEIAISKYERGWELRAELSNAATLKLTTFTNESFARESASIANRSLENVPPDAMRHVK